MDSRNTIHFAFKESVMRKIEDYENKMIHNGKRNIRYVLVPCDYCGKKTWKRWHSRIRNGDSQYCGKECFDNWQREDASQNYGKENARFNWDGDRWIAYWREDGKLKNTTKARWLWEMNHGDVPEGYWVTYKDENPANCELDNLTLIDRGERISEALMGHDVSLETRKKISIAHTGTKKWRGFSRGDEYKGFSKNLKSKIKKRDGYICQICKKDLFYKSKNTAIHHIDGNKKNSDDDNLITLCRDCHAAIHCKKDVSDEILAFRSMLKY